MTRENHISFGDAGQPPDESEPERHEPFDLDFDVGAPDIYINLATWEVFEYSGSPAKPPAMGFRGGRKGEALTYGQFREIIPQELQLGRTWCVWSFVCDDANQRWKKRPYLPFRGSRRGYYAANASKPQNWVKFEQACHAVWSDPSGLLEGLGRFFSPEDPFVGIDLDHCIDEWGNLAPWAAEIMGMFPGSYVETSPSGTGLKLWIRGTLPGPGLKIGGHGDDGLGAVEIYDRDRYFTVTGLHYGDPVRVIADGSAAVLALYDRMGGSARAKLETSVGKVPTVKLGTTPIASAGVRFLTDEQVVAKARRIYPEFGSLFDSGDLSKHGNDWSRADSALIKLIAFFAGGDPEQIERIFGTSALAKREKWVGRLDYRTGTISAVLGRMTKFHDPNYRSNSRRSASGGSSQVGGGA